MDHALFPTVGDDGNLVFKLEQVYEKNTEGNEANLDNNSKDKDLFNKGTTLHARLLTEQEMVKKKLEYDYAKAEFALSANPTVWPSRTTTSTKVCAGCLIGLSASSTVLPTPTVRHRGTLDEIVDVFWTEYEDFCRCRGDFDSPSWFRSPDAKRGRLDK